VETAPLTSVEERDALFDGRKANGVDIGETGVDCDRGASVLIFFL
jgi:hypothetical protein